MYPIRILKEIMLFHVKPIYMNLLLVRGQPGIIAPIIVEK